jgi:hypothetical protein
LVAGVNVYGLEFGEEMNPQFPLEDTSDEARVLVTEGAVGMSCIMSDRKGNKAETNGGGRKEASINLYNPRFFF